MKIVVHLSLVDLKRAVRRLMVRFSDEAETASDFLILKAHDHVVEIIAGETTEVLDAVVVYRGYAKLPFTLFRGVARSLRFHRERGIISIGLSYGSLRIDATEYRHANISVHASDAAQHIPVAKPAKLQNL